jgi:hypothetical protein
MQFKKMTVCNDSGMVPDADKDTLVPVNTNNPYQFYATTNTADNEKKVVVTIVMPLGGVQSGLFRFPRVGESVMVGVPGEDDADMSGTNYLMGYLPDTSGNYFDSTGTSHPEMLDREGEVFRYKKSGENSSENSYSEIGFYKQPADWPVYKKNADGTVYKKSEDSPPEIEGYPDIDRINIQSTGDIQSSAENHHLVMAKRFELLAGFPKIDHKTDRTKDGVRPLGDNPGDDSALHAGDAHIRAGNRVVIKAEEEICLQVGRSVISISDEGITIKSKITNSNFENLLDATLSLSPRDGVSMFGQDVNISSGKGFQLGDTYGGSISSTVGVVSINGREIGLGSYDTVEYLITVGIAGVKLIQSIASGSLALDEERDTEKDVVAWQYANIVLDLLGRLGELGKNVYAKTGEEHA